MHGCKLLLLVKLCLFLALGAQSAASLTVSCFVIDSLPRPILLGLDWLARINPLVNFTDRTHGRYSRGTDILPCTKNLPTHILES